MRESTARFTDYLQQLARQLNSSQSFSAGDDFELDVTTIRMPREGGKPKKYDPVKAAVRHIHKRSRITIKNPHDDMCSARALVTMKAWADEKGGMFPEVSYDNLRRGYPAQTRLARELLVTAGVPEGPCGLPELQKFQEVLQDYQIKVVRVGRPHMIIFAGPSKPRKLLLLLEDGHYDGCTSYASWFNRSQYCHECDTGFNTNNYAEHPCQERRCSSCESFDCANYNALRTNQTELQTRPIPSHRCEDCHRSFYGPDCFLRHLNQIEKVSICMRRRKCKDCCKTYELKYTKNGKVKGRRHKCGYAECKHCDKWCLLKEHQCYIQRLDDQCDDAKTKRVDANAVGTRAVIEEEEGRYDGKVTVEREPPLLVYADFEAITDRDGVQKAILIAYESSETDECITHYGEDCTERLLEDLEELAVDTDGDDRQVITLFHNLKGYDGMFLLQHMYDRHREVVNLVTVGVKVLSFTSDRLTFKDSLCFLPCPLATFPTTFGIRELTKGYFPHLFNLEENQEYEGPLPDISYYDPEGMSAKKKAEFERWHAEKRAEGYIFNLRKDMESYCVSDVKLLKAGCEKFVEEFDKEASFNPLVKCITIASACNRYWRKVHLEPDCVALQPVDGWSGMRSNQSQKALHWLKWTARHLGDETRIRHAFNGGEVRLHGMLVDGFDATTNTVYEFNGCFYHGCPRCFPKRRTTVTARRGDRSMYECYEATQKKKERLEAHGYAVVTRWECEWDETVKTNTTLTDFVTEEKRKYAEPLNPRDAFFGGRTNAVRLHHHIDQPGETIRYQDVTSLYPWVNKYALYPVGHPTILRDIEHVNIRAFFGLCRVTIVPPRGLYHPVLPYRHGGKLVFPLCRTCVETEMDKPLLKKTATCPHDDEGRVLQGTWCTPEVVEAVEQGYRLITIHEMWHFPESQRRTKLFSHYVDTWLKIKTEASGYPRWVVSEEDKRRYRWQYAQREGIRLDETNIEKNPGRKATAKLMLNSFWGKFGENLRKTSTETVNAPHKLYEIVCNPTLEVTNIRICNDNVLEVCYAQHEDETVENGRTNLFIACFTICHARLKLYSYLKKLGRQVLYFDTDSVIYSHVEGQESLENGDYLGDLTDELEDGHHIVDFTSGGPKNYGYRTSGNKTECKVRGFSLNSVRGSDQLNYEILRRNVLDELTDPLDGEDRRDVNVVNPYFFTRDARTKQLRVHPRTKQYGLVFDKRVVDVTNFMSFPYGYF